MKPTHLPPLKPKVVLGIAAHPDDLDFSAAGTMAAFAADGAAVYCLVVTDGSKGTSDLSMSSNELSLVREAEQRIASKILGCKKVQFLKYPDCELETTARLKRDIVKVIRTIKPDVVITWDPSMLYSAASGFINHPDHRVTGQAALDAVFPLACNPMAFPELHRKGYIPHKTKTILLANFDTSNFVVDITNTFDKKLAAYKAHTSQTKNIDEITKWLKEVAETSGKRAGYRLGEAFVRIDLQF